MGILISIIAINTEITKKNFDLYNQTKFLHQNNILISNINNLLNEKANLVTSKEILDILLGQKIDFQDEKSGIKMSVSMKSNGGKININNLLIKTIQDHKTITKYNQYIYDIIAQLLYDENVQDTEYFISLLADSIDSDLDERASYSEIANEDLRFENGAIFSKAHLSAIKDYYIKQNEDTSILKVNLTKYFKFNDGQLDINHIDINLIAKITNLSVEDVQDILDNNENITNLSDVFGIENNQTFNSLNVQTIAKQIICDLDILVYEKQSKAVFRYDFERKVTSDVKIYY